MLADMAKQPPEPRPPSPPPGTLPSQTATPKPCFSDDAAFMAAVRGTIRYEWIRLRREIAAQGKLPPEEAEQINEHWLEDLIAACVAGRVIPGFYRQIDRSCLMAWEDLACFARWYAQLSGLQAEEIRDRLSFGDEFPWADGGEFGFPPKFDPCTNTMTVDQRAYCCPEAVWTDSNYHTGSPPNFDKSSSSWAWLGAAGAVLLAGGIVAVAVAYGNRQNAEAYA